MKRNFTPEDVKKIEAQFDKVYKENWVNSQAVFDRLSVDWTPEEDEAFNEVERQSNLGKQILQDIKPKREWVGLTDDEIDEIYQQHHDQYDECISVNFGYERAIEAKLKEKNT